LEEKVFEATEKLAYSKFIKLQEDLNLAKRYLEDSYVFSCYCKHKTIKEFNEKQSMYNEKGSDYNHEAELAFKIEDIKHNLEIEIDTQISNEINRLESKRRKTKRKYQLIIDKLNETIMHTDNLLNQL